MKSNKEILDELGKKIIEEFLDVYFRQIYSLRAKENPPIIFKEKYNFFKLLTEEQFSGLKKIFRGNFEVSFFEFFKTFEENQHHKILYSEDGHEVDLTKIR